jgi:hypothetical protein
MYEYAGADEDKIVPVLDKVTLELSEASAPIFLKIAGRHKRENESKAINT